MNRNWDKCFDLVIVNEGGYVDNKFDPGGATNFGCTKATWEAYVGHQVTKEDMKNLNRDNIKPLYKRNYWDAIHGDALPSGLDYCLFDSSVNSGVNRTSKWIQEIVGVSTDGAIGNNTISAIVQINTVTLINEFSEKRLAFLQSLKTWPVFGKGWGKRVEEVRIKSLELT